MNLLPVCQCPQPEAGVMGQLLSKPPRAEVTHSAHYSGIFLCHLCHPSNDGTRRWMLGLDSRQEMQAADGPDSEGLFRPWVTLPHTRVCFN